MPINKCAPRLKLQYPVQIQQSEWHSPRTSHQCLAPLHTAHHPSSADSLTSKALTKMGSNPQDRRWKKEEEGHGEEREERRLDYCEIRISDLKHIIVAFHASYIYI